MSKAASRSSHPAAIANTNDYYRIACKQRWDIEGFFAKLASIMLWLK